MLNNSTYSQVVSITKYVKLRIACSKYGYIESTLMVELPDTVTTKLVIQCKRKAALIDTYNRVICNSDLNVASPAECANLAMDLYVVL